MAFKNEVSITIFGNPFIGADLGNEQTILEIANQVVNEAKALAPFDKGQLRNSIMYRTSEEQGGFNDGAGTPAEKEIDSKPKKGEGFVGTNLDYSIYLEFGTRFLPPQPFLRPAILLAADQSRASEIAERIMNEQMKGALKKGQKRDTFKL